MTQIQFGVAWVFLAVLMSATPVRAQEATLKPASDDPAAMARLATDVIARFKDEDRDQYLNTLFRLQMVAGRNDEAIATIRSLRELRASSDSLRMAWLFLQYEVVASARAKVAAGNGPFDVAFGAAFREAFGRIDNRTAYVAAPSFTNAVPRFENELQSAIATHKDATSLDLPAAIDLVRRYHVLSVHREMAAVAPASLAADEARRYIVDRDVLVTTPDGARIAAMVVRPRVEVRQTTLLGFTIYANDEWSMSDATRCAANGYAGVVAYTRGKGHSPDVVVPYEHDGDDARAVIDWIAKQSWSDGRVGMYGGSYNSFTQWAAAKRLPSALKCLMTSASAAPGIDVPMQGNVFMNFMYPWVPYVTNTKALDDPTYDDQARWNNLNRTWYSIGRAYRDLDAIDGTPSPIFRRWLDHPGYDAYWQRMIPYRDDFARIDIPVLATTGYFDGAIVGALYYFREHTRYNPKADHTIVIGPFEHLTLQRGVARNVQGYDVDPVAVMDLQQLRFAWFDYVLKGGPKPEILKDRVNYQVMGANVWKHAPTLDAMATERRRLFLSAARVGETFRLNSTATTKGPGVSQTIDFANRRDVDYAAAPLAINAKLDTHNGIAFTSDPVTVPTEISGLFSGQLDFVVNKKDFDLTVTLLEQLPTGAYFQLAYHVGRASYAKDRKKRSLLQPNRPQRLAFTAERLTSRLLQPGSRIVIVVSLNKQPDMQINYGSGRDVSDETIADANVPLRIRWLETSWIEVPVAQ